MMNVSMYGPNHDHHHSAAGYLPTNPSHHQYANLSSHHHHQHSHQYGQNHTSPFNSSNLQTSNSSSSIPNAITPPANLSTPTLSISSASTASSSVSTNAHQIYHPHLYSPTAVEYGITTSNATPPDGLYYDADPSSSAHSTYYHETSSGCATPSMIHDHIINTDNGLSYTNLDYMNYGSGASGYLSGGDDKMSLGQTVSSPYGHPSAESSLPYHHHHLHHHSAQSLPHHQQSNVPATSVSSWHMAQPVLDYMDSGHSSSSLSQQLSLGNLPGMHQQHSDGNQHQMRVANSSSNGGRSSSQNQTQQSLHAQHPASQSPVDLQPTYKWMQVKRNVPKAHCEFI